MGSAVWVLISLLGDCDALSSLGPTVGKLYAKCKRDTVTGPGRVSLGGEVPFHPGALTSFLFVLSWASCLPWPEGQSEQLVWAELRKAGNEEEKEKVAPSSSPGSCADAA